MHNAIQPPCRTPELYPEKRTEVQAQTQEMERVGTERIKVTESHRPYPIIHSGHIDAVIFKEDKLYFKKNKTQF